MAKINPAQLASLLASMNITVEGAADAKVAQTAKSRKTPDANAADYTLVRGQFKGHPTVTFTADGRRPISMGHGKIKLVLAHADALRKIVS